MINLKYSAAFLLISSSLAYASATLPVGDVGLDTLDTINYSSGSTCVTVDGVACGGEFMGNLGVGAANANPVAINFWCVDSQEDFSFGQSGLAQVVQLADITNDAANVRYSGVVNGAPAPGTWTNTAVSTGLGNVSLASDATTRYEMAAFLVTQFPGFDGSVDGGNQVSTAIEGAIWDIMSNNTVSSPFSYFTPTSGTPVDTDVDYWIYQASLETNYGTAAIADDFAVISWDANPNGDGLDSSAQTFLVELQNSGGIVTHDSPTPEPGFYGALAMGLSGLFFAVRRRKNA